ncbi:MAG TPA: hypothetical protein PK141_12255 [Polyangiaceae bacterium]|nr:hypothetical protein [Polyangiaceae bacterium]
MRPSVSLSLLAIAFAAACGTERRAVFDDKKDPLPPGSGADGGFVDFGNAADDGLAVDPLNAILFVDTSTTPPTPAKQTYKVVRKTANGETDLTARATFELEKPELGKFTGNNFESVATLPTTAPGFTTDVTVRVDGGSTGAKLTVVPLRRGADSARDFFFIVPYGQAPTPPSDVLKFKTNIQAVDVAFVVDTTGSMSSEINAIRTALGGSLLTQLQAAIPSVGIAIVSHKDEEDPAPQLVEVFQRITTTLSLAQSAAGRLNASGGGDTPEGQVPAMFHVLTGLPVTGVPAHTPAPGTTGGVDFRPGALPMVTRPGTGPRAGSPARVCAAPSRERTPSSSRSPRTGAATTRSTPTACPTRRSRTCLRARSRAAAASAVRASTARVAPGRPAAGAG